MATLMHTHTQVNHGFLEMSPLREAGQASPNCSTSKQPQLTWARIKQQEDKMAAMKAITDQVQVSYIEIQTIKH